MAGSVRRALGWRTATVVDSIAETATARSLGLDVAAWSGHAAGQHVDIRLTAEDGYQATRSYSVSSGPGEAPQITVERVDDGEVSPHLVDVAEKGDTFEVRGPIGGYFVWEPAAQPLVLIAGGSGIAPLRAMWRAGTLRAPITVVYSARDVDRLIFRDELDSDATLAVRVHLTREQRPGFRSGRVGIDDLNEVIDARVAPAIYVCGPTSFVESVSRHLLTLDVDRRTIRTERFG